MSVAGARDWMSHFFAALSEDRESASRLRESAIALDLATWTETLTATVVQSFGRMGLLAAAKGCRCNALPIGMNEYLGQDVMVFRPGVTAWRFPVAVCELENSADDDRVAYSLWKVLSVRSPLRVVFCYRAAESEAGPLVRSLADAVIGALPIQERVAIAGEVLVIVGSRNEVGTFPYGYFSVWKLNLNTGRFEQFAR